MSSIPIWKNYNKIIALQFTIRISARERKSFCILAIQLIQGMDMPFEDLIEIVDPSKLNVNRTSNKIKVTFD